MKKLLLVRIASFLISFGFVACGEESTINQIYHESVRQIAAGETLGDCTEKNAGEMFFVTDSSAVYYCAGGKWASLNGRNGANGKDGIPSRDTVYVYDSTVVMYELENDTYKWEAGFEGESRLGYINVENCYVYENSAWRVGNFNDCALGLNGCTTSRQNVVGLGSDNAWYICDANVWRASTNIEKDTVSWGPGKNGEVRAGQVNTSIYYVYEIGSGTWREASVIEKDTYDYDNNRNWAAGIDGEIRKGAITKIIYVYDALKWRAADAIESSLGGCVEAIRDSVGQVGSTYYICNPRRWNVVTASMNDTDHWVSDTVDGAWKKGSINKDKYYVYDKNEHAWRLATTDFDYTLGLDGCTVNRNKEKVNIYDEENEANHYYVCYNKKWYDGNVWSWDLPKDVYLNSEIEYDSIIDGRDGKVYKTVQIGIQTWMAENLNYADSSQTPGIKGKSWCYGNVESRCDIVGRLYTWAAAIDSVTVYENIGTKCGDGKTPCIFNANVQGICPEGWHLPSKKEWDDLFNFVGDKIAAKRNLTSALGWKKGGGSDLYGFSAISVGEKSSSIYYSMGVSGYFWSSTDLSESNTWFTGIDLLYLGFQSYNGSKSAGFSIRCIKNNTL